MPPKGNPRPRLYTPPLRELTPETSLGFECIEFAHDVVGVTLLPWQQEFLKGALELREDGTYRFRTVLDRKSTRLNSSHVKTSYAVFCLKKKNSTTPIHERCCR